MSRLERMQKEKSSKNKYKTVCRVIFLFLMLIITISSILLIDYRAHEVLDDDRQGNLTKYIMDIF